MNQTNHELKFAKTEQGSMADEVVADIVAKTCPAESYRGKRILLIVPDGTRTAPVGLMFKTLFAQIGSAAKSL
ncbi:MAG TPA: hypothetical protein VGF13_11020, partial [Verrucomicrobiae bacterium]